MPVVFVDGQPEKIERVRQYLPDAVYTPWRRIRSSLKRAIAHPPSDPVVPPSQSLLAGYSGTPLPKKLGLKANSVVLLLGAPKGFEKTLGDLPDGVVFRNRAQGRCDMAISPGSRATGKAVGRHRREGRTVDGVAEEVFWRRDRSDTGHSTPSWSGRRAG